MKRANEKGAAVILALILIAVLSVMAVSMMFLSQSEGWSSANYRLMSQARDGAEAGLNAAAAFLTDSTKYTPPVADAADPITGYVSTGTTVKDAGGTQIGLTADPNVSTTIYHYPIAAKQTAFNTATTGGKGTLAADNTTINYYSSARLLSQRAVNPTGLAVTSVVQTWEITGRGTVAGVQGADVEISAILDRDLSTTPPSSISTVITTVTTRQVPLFAYAAFGTSSTCSPVGLIMGGGGGGHDNTDSYNSHSASGSPSVACNPATIVSGGLSGTNCGYQPTTGGNLGTNGALSIQGSEIVGGSLSTPRTGVGSCAAGDAVNNVNLVTGGLVQLPTTLVYPTPPFPTTIPTTGSSPNIVARTDSLPNNASTCAGVGAAGQCGPTSPATKNNFVLQPGNYGDLSGGSQTVIHLKAGVYNINSLSQGAQATIVIDSGPVVLNVSGCSTFASGGGTCTASMATPLDMTGGGFQNTSMDASMFQINYGGTGTITNTGNSASAGVINAPNATYVLHGTTDMYGAVVARSVDLSGGGIIHYDRNLASGTQITYTTTDTTTSVTNWPATSNFAPNNYTLRQFTWKKF